MKTSRFASSSHRKIAFVATTVMAVVALLGSAASAEILKDPAGVLHMDDPEIYKGSAC